MNDSPALKIVNLTKNIYKIVASFEFYCCRQKIGMLSLLFPWAKKWSGKGTDVQYR
jgi:hypothetical protein